MHVLFPDYVVFDWVISFFTYNIFIYIFSYICTCFGDLFYEEALTLSQQSLFVDMMNIPSQNFSHGKHGQVNGKLGYCQYVKNIPSDNNEKN